MPLVTENRATLPTNIALQPTPLRVEQDRADFDRCLDNNPFPAYIGGAAERQRWATIVCYTLDKTVWRCCSGDRDESFLTHGSSCH